LDSLLGRSCSQVSILSCLSYFPFCVGMFVHWLVYCFHALLPQRPINVGSSIARRRNYPQIKGERRQMEWINGHRPHDLTLGTQEVRRRMEDLITWPFLWEHSKWPTHGQMEELPNLPNQIDFREIVVPTKHSCLNN
jgi:hypothetical protein